MARHPPRAPTAKPSRKPDPQPKPPATAASAAAKRAADGGLVVGPGPTHRSVRDAQGRVVAAPEDWVLLEPGDAALTRRVKAAGDHWLMQEKQGRRTFSRGVWAPEATVERIRHELVAERSTEAWAKKQAQALKRREADQAEYVDDFLSAVIAFLAFHPTYGDRALKLARAVTTHATPVGSGTVARTERIPIERRAEAAVIAWMRHQTTAYDAMKIPRVKGGRRAVRRMLAQRSQELLQRYRTGDPADGSCLLARALTSLDTARAASA